MHSKRKRRECGIAFALILDMKSRLSLTAVNLDRHLELCEIGMDLATWQGFKERKLWGQCIPLIHHCPSLPPIESLTAIVLYTVCYQCTDSDIDTQCPTWATVLVSQTANSRSKDACTLLIRVCLSLYIFIHLSFSTLTSANVQTWITLVLSIYSTVNLTGFAQVHCSLVKLVI